MSGIKRLVRTILAVAQLGILLPLTALAQVKVNDAWVRATVPQQQSTGAFMKLTGARHDLKLVEVRCPLAGVAEVHEMKLVDDVMRMRAMKALELPAGQTVELKPGGSHLMLMALNQQVKEGSTVPITMVFEDAGGKRETIEIIAPVRPLNSKAGAPDNQDPHQHHKH